MRTVIGMTLALFCSLCFAQKWVDDRGKTYYGDPPPGVKVKEAKSGGGTSSKVGSQKGSSASRGEGPSLARQEADFQQRHRERQILDHEDRKMRYNAANQAANREALMKSRARQRPVSR